VSIDGPFRWFNASLTCHFALIFNMSSIAFLIANVHYVMEGAGGSSLLIQGYVPKTRRVGTKLSGPAVSFIAFTPICRTISLVTPRP
jgi:hypothetical protein